MDEVEGWILDVFSHPRDGLALYFLTDAGVRLRLHRPFPVTFYAAGPPGRIRQAWRYLQKEAPRVRLARQVRRDLFSGPRQTLAIETPNPEDVPPLFRRLERRFPDLTWYDVDIPLALRFWAQNRAFPLARCRIHIEPPDLLKRVEPLASPWDLAPLPAPLRVCSLTAEGDVLRIAFGARTFRIPLSPSAQPAGLLRLARLLRALDPDILFTSRGDTHILPLLLALSRRWKVPLPLNREPGRLPLRKPAITYHAYGQTLRRGQQVLLYGRLHIDRENAPLARDCGLEDVLETARVTGLPVQEAARASAGSGVTAMQMLTALRRGVLVPWKKAAAERPRASVDFFSADQGGLVYQPIPGVHAHVAEIDFVSMYPALMVRYNLSPETVGPRRPGARRVPELDLWVSEQARGLIPETLAPLASEAAGAKGHDAASRPGLPAGMAAGPGVGPEAPSGDCIRVPGL